MTAELRCKDCGTTDRFRHYKSGKMQRCYDCQNYANLTTKATGGGVEFSREEFLAWKEMPQHRNCVYCGIDTDLLYKLQICNPRNKKPFESIGVDRIDNALPYTLSNIQPCCGPCNSIKSSLLTDAEMKRLGLSIRALWDERIKV